MAKSIVVDFGTTVQEGAGLPHVVHLDQAFSNGLEPEHVRLARYTQDRLEELGADEAIFLTGRSSDSHLRLATQIKKAMPNLRVVLSGDRIDLESALSGLRQNEIDLVVRSSNLVEAALQAHTRGAAQPEIQTLWKGSNGLIQWNRRRAEKTDKPRVLLVLMPAWNNDYAPSGLAHIAASLKKAGYPVDVLDLNWMFWIQLRSRFRDSSEYGSFLLWTTRKKYEAEARPFLGEIFKSLEDQLRKKDYAYVGFSLFETSINASRDAFELIRKFDPRIRIFCGGPSAELDASFQGKTALQNNQLDAVVIGEGEASAVDLLDSWSSGSDRAVPGVCLRAPDGTIREGGNRPLANINELPFPDFSGFSVYDYDKFELPAYFSRGCVAKCTFCSETQFWVRFRILTPERVIEAMKRSMQEYGIPRFRFTDSLLNGSHRHLEKFADQVVEQGLKVKFFGYCRLDNDLSGSLLKKLAKAGCISLAFGMESASQRVTELMRKEVDVSKYTRIIKDSSEAGIENVCCVIIGFPGEKWIDFFKTTFKILSLRRHIHILNLSVPTLGQIQRSEKDMQLLGIHPDLLNVDEWRTNDGTNTPGVRMFRFWILQTLWRLAKAKGLAPSWIYRPA